MHLLHSPPTPYIHLLCFHSSFLPTLRFFFFYFCSLTLESQVCIVQLLSKVRYTLECSHSKGCIIEEKWHSSQKLPTVKRSLTSSGFHTSLLSHNTFLSGLSFHKTSAHCLIVCSLFNWQVMWRKYHFLPLSLRSQLFHEGNAKYRQVSYFLFPWRVEGLFAHNLLQGAFLMRNDWCINMHIAISH